MADGHLNKCKDCVKEANRQNREAKIEYYREYDKQRANDPDRVSARAEYAKTEAYRESHEKASAKYREANMETILEKQRISRVENKEKHQAREKLLWAVKSKKVIRPDQCERCGVECVPHGHHHDYSKPLDVNWLCPKCHGKEHSSDTPWYNALI